MIQLSEEGAALGAREMRSSSRDTIKHFEADMALATALAQVRVPRGLGCAYDWGVPVGPGACSAGTVGACLVALAQVSADAGAPRLSSAAHACACATPPCRSAAWRTARSRRASPRWRARGWRKR